MSKGDKLRAGVERFLSEQGDPAQVERVLNRMTSDDKSVPDRLYCLWSRIKSLEEEAGDLSSLLEYHSGSRLSRVIDHLEEARTLTEETMRMTTGQAPTEFRISDKGDIWGIWDDSVGVGIEFNKGDERSRQNLRYIQTEETIEDGDLIGRAFDRLIKFAEERFPTEFGSEVH